MRTAGVVPPLIGKSLSEIKAYELPDPSHSSRFKGLKEKANMPPEHLLALFKLGREFGTYPIDNERIDQEINRLKAKSIRVGW